MVSACERMVVYTIRTYQKKRSAYKYLALSIEKFPKYGDFCSELSAAGFKEVKYRALTGGVALLYTGKKS